jgi:hypothetical protein
VFERITETVGKRQLDSDFLGDGEFHAHADTKSDPKSDRHSITPNVAV